MVRVLQMIPRDPDFESAHQIDVLGGGLPCDIQLCHLPLACAAVRYSLLRNRIRSRRAAPDLIHTWNWSGLRWSLAAARCPILHSIKSIESHGQIRALKRLAVLTGRIALICSTPLQKQMLERAGIPPHRCHVIEPGAEAGSVPHDHRLRIRQSLQLGAEDVVAFAPGDSTPSARHRLSLWAISILHVYDRRYRLLISGTGAQAPFLDRLARKLKQPAVLVSASKQLGRVIDQGELLAASDVALAVNSLQGSPLPMALCMTSGTPIIGDADGLAGQYAAEDSSTLLTRPLRPKLLARHILESFPIGAKRIDQGGARQLGPVERFDPARFRRQMCDLYRAVCRGPHE